MMRKIYRKFSVIVGEEKSLNYNGLLPLEIYSFKWNIQQTTTKQKKSVRIWYNYVYVWVGW